MKDERPWVLDDPERLKALAHPMRRQMLHHLNVHGPATSTTLGELLGAKTGTTSYHLRQLEKYGFIEEIAERSTGRERWWRRIETGDIRLPTPDQVSDEDLPVLSEFYRQSVEEDRDLLARMPAAFAADPAWARHSRGLGRMTSADLDAFFEEYMELLKKYGRRVEDAAEGSRPMLIRLFALPGD